MPFPSQCVKVKSESEVTQSFPTLSVPMDCSLPGCSIHGIFQAKVLEWGAISFSNACMHAKPLQSCPTLCDPMGSSPLGSSVHRILQARTLLLQTLPSFPGLTGASALFDPYCTDEETGLECENNSSKSAHHVRRQEEFEPLRWKCRVLKSLKCFVVVIF